MNADLSSSSPTFLDQDYASSLSDFSPNYIVDNFSKSPVNASFVLNIAKKHKSDQVTFISSAGMYKSGLAMPIDEDGEVKLNAAREVEIAYAESDVKSTFLRPQVIFKFFDCLNTISLPCVKHLQLVFIWG